MDRERNELVWRLIDVFNDRQDFSTKIFDCDSLGVLQLWFVGTWEWKWINPIPLPQEFRKGATENLLREEGENANRRALQRSGEHQEAT